MAKHNLPLKWTQGLTGQLKADFESSVKSSLALRRLYEILEDMERELTTVELSESAYDSPAWAYKQASINGERRQIRKLKDLLSFTTNR